MGGDGERAFRRKGQGRCLLEGARLILAPGQVMPRGRAGRREEPGARGSSQNPELIKVRELRKLRSANKIHMCLSFLGFKIY